MFCFQGKAKTAMPMACPAQARMVLTIRAWALPIAALNELRFARSLGEGLKIKFRMPPWCSAFASGSGNWGCRNGGSIASATFLVAEGFEARQDQIIAASIVLVSVRRNSRV